MLSWTSCPSHCLGGWENMLGFGVLLNVLNRFSNAGFGKAHILFCQMLFHFILNPCVFQGKFYPHVSDLFTPNSSMSSWKNCYWMFKNSRGFFLSLSSFNQCVSFGLHQKSPGSVGVSGWWGYLFVSQEFSSAFWRLSLYPTSPSSSSVVSFPKFYFFVFLI